jgi:F-type H+-transporting ATPase subunit b
MIFILALAGKIQLVPDGTLLFHIFLILLMVAVLNATLFKPINKILAERDATTRGRFSEAQSVIQSVKEKMEEYEAALRNARAEGYALAEQERLNSLKEREQQMLKLRAEMSSWLATEKQKLANETRRAQEQLEVESRELGEQIASRIIGRQVSSR